MINLEMGVKKTKFCPKHSAGFMSQSSFSMQSHGCGILHALGRVRWIQVGSTSIELDLKTPKHLFSRFQTCATPAAGDLLASSSSRGRHSLPQAIIAPAPVTSPLQLSHLDSPPPLHIHLGSC